MGMAHLRVRGMASVTYVAMFRALGLNIHRVAAYPVAVFNSATESFDIMDRLSSCRYFRRSERRHCCQQTQKTMAMEPLIPLLSVASSKPVVQLWLPSAEGVLGMHHIP